MALLFIVIGVVGKGFFVVFKDDLNQAAKLRLKSAAEAICNWVGEEQNGQLAFGGKQIGDYEIFAKLTGTDPVAGSFTKDSVAASKDLSQDKLSDNIMSWEEEFDERHEIGETEKEDRTEQQALEELAAKENGIVKENNTEEVLLVERIDGGVLPILKEEQAQKTETEKTSEKKEEGEEVTEVVSVRKLLNTEYSLEKMKNLNYLLANFYIVDSSTKATASLFQTDILLNKDLTLEKNKEDVQILIYHTHASEGYSDSRPGEEKDTVVGPGEYLTELLRAKGYKVYHDKTAYDRKDGKDNRNYAYSTARPSIEAYLKKHPSVEVVIDLHRDGGTKRVAMVNGKETAQVMLFNGLCRNANGPIADLENPYILDNLAFSLQTNLVGRSMYPGLMYKIYLKNYRYNQHLCPRYLLIELGTQQNTVQEAYNAMEPLAEILNQVLTNP